MTKRLMLVVDLECTCSDGSTPPADQVAPERMEIIEIGAVIVTLQGEVVDRFGRLVRPVDHPTLSTFCTRLTAIQQVDVAGAASLGTVLAELARWLEPTWASLVGWGSWGAFDCRQLQRECARKGLGNPLASLRHTNLKDQFAKRRRIKQVGMAKALELTGMPLLGSHHRGLDDALNIARLLPHALSR